MGRNTVNDKLNHNTNIIVIKYIMNISKAHVKCT